MDLDTYNKFRTCKTCGGSKELQRSITCPKCESPKIISFEHLDFETACRHVDARYYGAKANEPRPERQIIKDAFALIRDESPYVAYSYLPITLAAYGGYDLEPSEIQYLLHLIEAFDLHQHESLLWEIKW